MFVAAESKKATMFGILHRPTGKLVDCLKIHHLVVTAEAENIRRLRTLIGQVTLSQEKDRLIWADNSDTLTIKECTKRLIGLRLLFFSPGVVHFKWDKVWNHSFPSKVSFLVWLLVRKRILTPSNVKLRVFNMVFQCYFCRNNEEDDVHLFLNCPLSRKVLDYFSVGQHVNWRNSFDKFISHWRARGNSQLGKKIKKFIPLVSIWVLW